LIPAQNIIAWGNIAPWAEQRQIEQDLIISRAIIEIFSDDFLKEQLRFRGGTALNKLHFPAPLRYSEDIDFVRTTEGPIGPILDRLREVLAWLGTAQFEQSPVAPKLNFEAEAESGGQLKLKLEISTRERTVYDEPIAISHAVDNPWFAGQADILTFTNEEMLATKLRALLQRNKGRDLFDIAHALTVFGDLDAKKVASMFQKYLAVQDDRITRAQAEERMFGKLANPAFLRDLRPLLPPDQADKLTDEDTKDAFITVFTGLITHIEGKSWARMPEMAERFSVDVAG